MVCPSNGVVCVDQEDGAVREAATIGPEGFNLSGEAGDEGMGHGPSGWNTIDFASQHIAGGGNPSNVTTAGHLHPGVHAVGATQREIADDPALGSRYAPRCLGGDERLKVNLVDDKGLYSLGLHHRTGNLEDGLLWEEDSPFGYGPHVARKPHLGQRVEEVLVKDAGEPQVLDVTLREAPLFQITQHLLQAGAYHVSTVRGCGAHMQTEGGPARHAVLEVALGHGQLVQVGQKTQLRAS